MKKIFYLFAIIGFVFTSCNPLEDVNQEVDALTANDALVDDLVLTLTDKDYEILDLGFGNFSSIDDAKEMLPGFLATKYPQLGATFLPNGGVDKASTAFITYKLYNKKNDEKSLTIYEVSSADYTAGGHRYGNFDSFSDITEFLDTKYPSAENRLLVSLTYKYFSGGVSTLNNGFINNAGTWEMSTGISEDEYTAMGEGRAQFSSEDEALVKIPVLLNDKFKFEGKEAGDIEGIMYKLYVTDTQDVDGDGSVEDRTVYSFVVFFIFDGSNWSKYNNTINESIQLGHDGKNWVPDNTIKRTLTAGDVAFISSAFIATYPGPADNLDFFKSFDVRESSDNYWSDDMLLEAFNALLNDLDPSAEEGQKYSLTYVVYDGSTVNKTINLIKTSGVFVKQ